MIVPSGRQSTTKPLLRIAAIINAFCKGVTAVGNPFKKVARIQSSVLRLIVDSSTTPSIF
jgi:hypothetical protein